MDTRGIEPSGTGPSISTTIDVSASLSIDRHRSRWEETSVAPATWKIWRRAEVRHGASCDAACRLDERTTADRAVLTRKVR